MSAHARDPVPAGAWIETTREHYTYQQETNTMQAMSTKSKDGTTRVRLSLTTRDDLPRLAHMAAHVARLTSDPTSSDAALHVLNILPTGKSRRRTLDLTRYDATCMAMTIELYGYFTFKRDATSASWEEGQRLYRLAGFYESAGSDLSYCAQHAPWGPRTIGIYAGEQSFANV